MVKPPDVSFHHDILVAWPSVFLDVSSTVVIYTSQKTNECPLKKGLFQSEIHLNQASFFRGYVSFQGGKSPFESYHSKQVLTDHS